MDSYTESIKLFISAVMASGVSLFGISFKYVLVLVFLMIVDTVFGWIRSKKNNQWNISTAKCGFIGKIIELIFIWVLCILDWIFDINLLKYMGIFYFGICEVASIVDNYSGINKNMPDGVLEIVKNLKYSVGTLAVSKIKNILSQVFDFQNKDKNTKD